MSDPAPALDVDLLRRIGEGDSSALSAFYDLHARTLFALAYRMLRDHKEAEDVLQEVLLQIWNKGATFNPGLGRPLAWALTLTRHKAIDRIRATERRRTHLVDGGEDLPEAPAASASMQEAAADQDQSAIIQRALADLPEPQRRAIELAFFTGMTQTEVAAALNEPLGTVKARIRRGMQKLRHELEQRL